MATEAKVSPSAGRNGHSAPVRTRSRTAIHVVDLTDHDAMIAVKYDGAPIEIEHGGPVRLPVPHLYLWKSAKWLREIRLSDQEDQGFWQGTVAFTDRVSVVTCPGDSSSPS